MPTFTTPATPRQRNRPRDSAGQFAGAQHITPDQFRDAYDTQGKTPRRLILGKDGKLRDADNPAYRPAAPAAKTTPAITASRAEPADPADRQFANTPPHAINFDTTLVEGGGSVDAEKGIIYGVSVITAGIEAKGHGLKVDDTTLKQMFNCATLDHKGKVAVRENHNAGVDGVTGYLCNFRCDGVQLRADWQLLETYKNRAQILEVAKTMPEKVGLSASFKGHLRVEVAKDGKENLIFETDPTTGEKKARCYELYFVDYVALPAANPSGLFSAKTISTSFDSTNPTMPTDNTDPNAAAAPEGDALANLQAENDALKAQIAELQAALDGGDGGDGEPELYQTEDGQIVDAEGNPVEIQEGDPTEDGGEGAPAGDEDPEAERENLTALLTATDFQLRQHSLTREDVLNAVTEFNAAYPAFAIGGTAGASPATVNLTARIAALENELRNAKHAQEFAAQKKAIDAEVQRTAAAIAERDDKIIQLQAQLEDVKFRASGAKPTNFSASDLGGNPEQGSYPALVEAKALEFQAAGKHKSQALLEAQNFCQKAYPVQFNAHVQAKINGQVTTA